LPSFSARDCIVSPFRDNRTGHGCIQNVFQDHFGRRQGRPVGRSGFRLSGRQGQFGVGRSKAKAPNSSGPRSGKAVYGFDNGIIIPLRNSSSYINIATGLQSDSIGRYIRMSRRRVRTRSSFNPERRDKDFIIGHDREREQRIGKTPVRFGVDKNGETPSARYSKNKKREQPMGRESRSNKAGAENSQIQERRTAISGFDQSPDHQLWVDQAGAVNQIRGAAK